MSHLKGCQAADFTEDKGRGESDTLQGHGKDINERPRVDPMESPDGTVKRVQEFLRLLFQVIGAINTNNKLCH